MAKVSTPHEELAAVGATGRGPVGQLGQRLRRAREERQLSLRAVARELGVSPSLISRLETGKSQPSVATLYALSPLLDVSIDQLFTPEAPAGTDPAVGSGLAAVATDWGHAPDDACAADLP